MATILVGDDDHELLETYELWLVDDRDWTVRTAADGDELVESLDGSVDVAVLDRRMPGTAGDEVARTIQSTYPECAVVVVSAFQPDGNIDERTYDQYLTKPVDRGSLVGAIESQLNAPVSGDS